MLIAGGGVGVFGAAVAGGAVAGVSIAAFAGVIMTSMSTIVHGRPDEVVARLRTDATGTVAVRRRHLAETRLLQGTAAPIAPDLRFKGKRPACYDAIVDFTTLTLTPRGRNCLLRVDGQLVFSGTIEGAATGTTTALVFATCSEVATTPPGTHPDVFKSELAFEGTIDGVPAEGDMMYQGRSQEGGRIEGRIIGSRGISGVLEVDAQRAVGGSYSGLLVVH